MFVITDRSILQKKNVIYCLTNLVNGKKYVGMTTRKLQSRLNEYIDYVMLNEHPMLIVKALKIHHIENFSIEILESCRDLQSLINAEIKWIAQLETFGNGYNLTKGGEGISGYKHSEETRKRMSEMRRGKKNHNYGKSWGRTGPLSDETKQKISKAKLGVNIHTDETKRRIGDAAKIHKRKSVLQCDKEGNIIREHPSLIDAAKYVGGQPNKISDVLRGGRKTHKKYIWKYANPERDEV